MNGLKSLTYISIGDIVGTGITAVFWFYLASVMNPEEYGEIHYFLGIAAISSVIVLFGTQNTITVYVAKNIKIQSTFFIISLLGSFYRKCIDDFNLKIIGIMCIPPNDNLSVYFSKMRELSDNFKFPELSMGMSNDYLRACEYKATFLRIGSKIFGS